MRAPETPKNERERLNALLKYNVLDTDFENDYDDLVKLASQICQTPISLVSLIDKDRQWFKAKVGLEARQTPRELAFCAHAIHQNDLFVVNDATKDERFADNPLVTGSPNVIFYAGKPLTTPEGLNIGTLCVIDNKPRTLTKEQEFALEIIGNQIISNLEKRLKIAEYHQLSLKVLEQNEELVSQEEELRQNLEELQAIQEQLEEKNIKQDVTNKVLQASLRATTNLQLFLEEVVAQLSRATFLNLQPGIGIFIKKEGDIFELKAHKDIAPQIVKLCNNIKSGDCLCGLAIKEKKTQYAHCVDERHTITFEGIKEHGHYNLPIIYEDNVIGAMVVYLAHGHQKNEQEIQFLESICYIIAETINKIRYRETIRQQNQELQQSLEQVTLLKLKTEKASKEIELQRDDILSSIRYAYRIQTALLPKKEFIKKWLPNSFVYYIPKDIVSGDFYWLSDAKDQSKEIILAIADCTGHGVPGAFMTVIGNNLLDQIINKDKIFSPAEILKVLDTRVIKTLQQQGAEMNKVNDGMDIAILKVHLATRKITFAAAKRPLWVFEKGKALPTEYKGDKFPIGGGQFKTEKIFTEKAIYLNEGDTLYLFTDGYADQFGEQGKFTLKRFRELLKQIYDKPFEIQESILQKALQEWRVDEKQTDDVLLIGIKV